MLKNNKVPLWVVRSIAIFVAFLLLLVFFFGSYSGLGSSL